MGDWMDNRDHGSPDSDPSNGISTVVGVIIIVVVVFIVIAVLASGGAFNK